MSAHCCAHETPKTSEIVNLARYRRILWIALLVNAAMFLVEIWAGWRAGSLSAEVAMRMLAAILIIAGLVLMKLSSS